MISMMKNLRDYGNATEINKQLEDKVKEHRKYKHMLKEHEIKIPGKKCVKENRVIWESE